MDSEIKRTFREYTWSYFALHADQRIKTFNFFLIVAGLLAGGITTLLKDNGYARWVSPFGVLLTILSFVFWKLDDRNKQLVKNAEEAIKYLDSQEGLADQGQNPHVLKMFDRDDYLTKGRSMFPLVYGHFSYSTCFGLVFWFFGLLGLFFAVASFFVTKL